MVAGLTLQDSSCPAALFRLDLTHSTYRRGVAAVTLAIHVCILT